MNTWSSLQIPTLNARKDKTVVRLLKEIRREKRSLMSAFEQYLIFSVARAQRERPGAIAEVGKHADMVVLDRNLFEIAPETIYDTLVKRTVFAGETVYEAD